MPCLAIVVLQTFVLLQTWDTYYKSETSRSNGPKHVVHIVLPPCIVRMSTLYTLNNPRRLRYNHQRITVVVPTFTTRKRINFLFHRNHIYSLHGQSQRQTQCQPKIQSSIVPTCQIELSNNKLTQATNITPITKPVTLIIIFIFYLHCKFEQLTGVDPHHHS